MSYCPIYHPIVHPNAPEETFYYFNVELQNNKKVKAEIKIRPRTGENEASAWSKLKILYNYTNAKYTFISMRESEQ